MNEEHQKIIARFLNISCLNTSESDLKYISSIYEQIKREYNVYRESIKNLQLTESLFFAHRFIQKLHIINPNMMR